jgi:hypothetical protein
MDSVRVLTASELGSFPVELSGVQYVDPSFGRPPMINNWSLEVQHEIAPDLIADVAYVGQHSTQLRTNFDSRRTHCI